MKKNFFQLSAIVCILSLLTGCGSTAVLTQADLTAPIHKGEARIIIIRDKSFLYGGGAATITVNGEEVASLGTGGEASTDVQAGHIGMSVKTPLTAGKFTLHFDAKAGKTYKFLISPRSGQYWTGGFFGVIGDAVNASVSEQSGYFQIVPKDIK